MKNRSLHGLRGLASLMVVFYHIYGMAYLGGFFPKLPEEGFIRYYNELGVIGVSIFFVISGYLITKSIVRHHHVTEFLLGRVRRIYPVFATFHLALFVVGPIVGYETLTQVSGLSWLTMFVSNLVLLPGVFDLPIAQKNAWTLSYEFAFYLLTALFFLGGQWLRAAGKQRYGVLVLAAAAMLSACLLLSNVIVVLFLIGIAVYFTRGWISRLVIPRALYPLDLLCFLALFALLVQGEALGMPQALAMCLMAAVCYPLFVCIINEQGLLASLMKSRPLQLYGTISYSLYLVHPFMMYPLKKLFGHPAVAQQFPNPAVAIILFGVCCLAASSLAAAISYQLLEVKLTDWLFDAKKRREQQRTVNATDPRPTAQVP